MSDIQSSKAKESTLQWISGVSSSPLLIIPFLTEPAEKYGASEDEIKCAIKTGLNYEIQEYVWREERDQKKVKLDLSGNSPKADGSRYREKINARLSLIATLENGTVADYLIVLKSMRL